MKRQPGTKARIAWGALAMVLSAAWLMYAWPSSPAAIEQPSAVVRIQLENGHGSGVHIGRGLFLTAAHVVDLPVFELKLSDGSVYPGELLWASKEYDVALVQVVVVDIDVTPAAAVLACAPLQVGEAIHAIGNPFDLGITTTHGRVAGLDGGKSLWKEVVVADMTVGAGMSGGPVFGAFNALRGIVVGAFGQLSSLSFIVPSSTICKLMARA